MSHITYVEIRRFLPRDVKRIIAQGGGCWIGEIDETTVLKYPHTPEEMKWVRIEAKILGVLGQHARIVQSKGLANDGLLLELAPNATEAVAYVHSKRVLHCDIRHDNLLLDASLDLKLADFQGQHFSAEGEILLDALSVESTKSYLPRKPADHASIRTDLFALGSAIYFIMMGHEVFPDLDRFQDEDEIGCRFRGGEFPTDPHICAAITAKCWKQLDSSARQALGDLEEVQAAIARGETPDFAKNAVPARGGDAPPQATWWLSSLCDDTQGSKEPPPYRQLVGFD